MQFESKVTGITELDKTFANLPRSTQRKAIIPALRAGGDLIRGMAENNLSQVVSGESTGLLEKSLRVYTLKKYRGAYRVAVQVKRGLHNTQKIVNGQPVRAGLYAAVLEYGKEGQPPRSWIRKAIREGEPSAYQTITNRVAQGMVEAVREAKQ